MLGGAGAIQAMITSMKNNNLIRREKRNSIKNHAQIYHSRKPLKFTNKMTPKEFDQFKSKLKKEKIFYDVLKLTIVIAVLGLSFAFFYKIMTS